MRRSPGALLPLLLLAASCGGSSGGSQTAGSGSAPAPLDLTFVQASATVAAPQVPIGVQSGIFQKVGLNVSSQYVGSNIASLVVSGQGQVGGLGNTGVISLATQGKPTTIIWAFLGNGLAAPLFGRSGISTIDQLKAKAGSCKIGALAPGTSNYGWAAHYNNSLGLHCTLVPYGSGDVEAGALATGQVDAATSQIDAFGNLTSQGKANILIDSRDPAQRKQYMGAAFSDVAMFVMNDWLNGDPSHKEAIRRFVKAMGMVDQLLLSKTPAQLADLLLKDTNFRVTPRATLEASLKNDKAYWNGIDHGYISEADWNAGLDQEGSWGVKDFDPRAPAAQYTARVNMSYYTQQLGKPKS